MMMSMVVLALAAGPVHFDLSASYDPPSKPGSTAAVVVLFSPRNPDVAVDEEPAPRIKLDPEQSVLLDKQPPPSTRVQPADPATAKFLDPKVPVRFPVALSPSAPKGTQTVKATVTYFYCSTREGWCRKGATEVAFPVDVR
jgi:hypothetical protein